MPFSIILVSKALLPQENVDMLEEVIAYKVWRVWKMVESCIPHSPFVSFFVFVNETCGLAFRWSRMTPFSSSMQGKVDVIFRVFYQFLPVFLRYDSSSGDRELLLSIIQSPWPFFDAVPAFWSASKLCRGSAFDLDVVNCRGGFSTCQASHMRISRKGPLSLCKRRYEHTSRRRDRWCSVDHAAPTYGVFCLSSFFKCPVTMTRPTFGVFGELSCGYSSVGTYHFIQLVVVSFA